MNTMCVMWILTKDRCLCSSPKTVKKICTLCVKTLEFWSDSDWSSSKNKISLKIKRVKIWGKRTRFCFSRNGFSLCSISSIGNLVKIKWSKDGQDFAFCEMNFVLNLQFCIVRKILWKWVSLDFHVACWFWKATAGPNPKWPRGRAFIKKLAKVANITVRTSQCMLQIHYSRIPLKKN